MTDKAFRRLSRTDPVELTYKLQRSGETRQRNRETLKRRLEERRVTIPEADARRSVKGVRYDGGGER